MMIWPFQMIGKWELYKIIFGAVIELSDSFLLFGSFEFKRNIRAEGRGVCGELEDCPQNIQRLWMSTWREEYRSMWPSRWTVSCIQKRIRPLPKYRTSVSLLSTELPSLPSRPSLNTIFPHSDIIFPLYKVFLNVAFHNTSHCCCDRQFTL